MGIVAPDLKSNRLRVFQPIAARDLLAHATDDLMKDGLVLPELSGANAQHQITLRIKLNPVRAGHAQGNRAGVGAGGDGEIVLQFSFVAVIDQINTRINLRDANPVKGRNLRSPVRRVIAQDVVYLAGQGVQAGHGGLGIAPNEVEGEGPDFGLAVAAARSGATTQTGRGLGRGQADDHLGGAEQECSAAAAGKKLGWRRRLAAVGLEEKRQAGQRRMGGGCGSLRSASPPRRRAQDQ